MAPDERVSRVLRRLVLPVYLPIVAGTFGLALLVPVLPLYLTEVGLSLRMTSVVLSGVGIGATIGGLPAGALIARFGERRVMFAAIAAVAITSAVLGLTEASIALVAMRLGTGAANIALRLSRQTYITRRVARTVRGRAMSTIGGSFRMSLFVGPLLGGVLADTLGFEATFAIAGAVTALGMIPPLLQPAAERDDVLDAEDGSPVDPIGLFESIRVHRRVLALVAFVPMLTMAVREGRYVVVPLIGDDLGLSPTAVGALVTVGTAADLVLFPVAGYVLDRFGRLAAMVPSFGLIAIGLVVLGFADTTGAAVVAGAIMGIGNGLSSGSLLTLGSDLAPADAPGPFLAAIAVIQDVGKIIGPLLVGFVGSAASLGTASLVLAGLMVFVIAWLVLVVGETSPRHA
ncbi:MFS transporter [Ilumatobacter coccineus]|uniref:Putative major facilitator superfamily transporter n=1 Tax=Ilumatobacter coccineus (strain NBRC 103263 / KCTC 29153 / YM16-304) TaxID=1313172 RepID=A0A6C7EB76_ILUCY|nr:MFS transporter [Ilumatobacter coccineus]BAN03731.1 putative major facilitator superfamily transporter [Ilumatobacter coccineus YM16-304]